MCCEKIADGAAAGADGVAEAERRLLLPVDLTLGRVQDALFDACGGLDWADVYVERVVSESWRLEEGIVKAGSYGIDGGMGLRAVCGDAAACVGSDIVGPAALAALPEAARVAKTRGDGGVAVRRGGEGGCPPPRFGVRGPEAEDAVKIAWLRAADARCRAAGEEVENVMVSLALAHKVVLVVRADGGVAADFRPMLRFGVQVVARRGTVRETGFCGGGGRMGCDWLTEARVVDFCDRAVADVRAKLEADPAPAGRMPVVLGPGWAGILLHEAVGHGLEGDFNRKGLSAFSGRVGEKVAAAGVTVIDAGNIDGRRGSLTVDDEGTPTRETVLIENGILRGYMQDIVNARKMGAAATGNGRRQSYAYPPMPRMTNTFMPAGAYAPEEIIASVKAGIYAEDFNGGEVDITNGNFVFVASRARRIENGKLGAMLRGATIIGNGPEVMRRVSMVGSDFALDGGMGTCGKEGQWVPVGVGQPTMKIDAITVGGAAGV